MLSFMLGSIFDLHLSSFCFCISFVTTSEIIFLGPLINLRSLPMVDSKLKAGVSDKRYKICSLFSLLFLNKFLSRSYKNYNDSDRCQQVPLF